MRRSDVAAGIKHPLFAHFRAPGAVFVFGRLTFGDTAVADLAYWFWSGDCTS